MTTITDLLVYLWRTNGGPPSTDDQYDTDIARAAEIKLAAGYGNPAAKRALAQATLDRDVWNFAGHNRYPLDDLTP